MKQNPVDFFRLSDVRFSTTAMFEEDRSFDAIAIHFHGAYGQGSQGNGDGRFMAAMTHAVLQAWRPAGIILDLRELEYQFGNTLLDAITAGREEDKWITPTRLVVSGKCDNGITTLMAWNRLDPADWLFRTVEEAYQKVKLIARTEDELTKE